MKAYTADLQSRPQMCKIPALGLSGFILSVLFTGTVAALTPVPVQETNDVRGCFEDIQICWIGQVQASLIQKPDRPWTSAPDAKRFARRMVVESTSGMAQAAPATGEFADVSVMSGIVNTPPGRDVTRSYDLNGPSYTATHVDSNTPDLSQSVTLAIKDVPRRQTRRALSAANSGMDDASDRAAYDRALNVCLRISENAQKYGAALTTHGVMPDIKSAHMDARISADVTHARRAVGAPDKFSATSDTTGGYKAFHANPTLNTPICSKVCNEQRQDRATCTYDRTSRITIFVAG